MSNQRPYDRFSVEGSKLKKNVVAYLWWTKKRHCIAGAQRLYYGTAHSRKDKKTIFPSEIFEKAFPVPAAQQPDADAPVIPALEPATPVKAAAADDAMDEDAADESIIADFGDEL